MTESYGGCLYNFQVTDNLFSEEVVQLYSFHKQWYESSIPPSPTIGIVSESRYQEL